jgi:hypothetical protein
VAGFYGRARKLAREEIAAVSSSVLRRSGRIALPHHPFRA